MKKVNSKKPEKSEKKTLDKIRFARINKSKRYKPLPVIEEVSQSESDTSM